MTIKRPIGMVLLGLGVLVTFTVHAADQKTRPSLRHEQVEKPKAAESARDPLAWMLYQHWLVSGDGYR